MPRLPALSGLALRLQGHPDDGQRELARLTAPLVRAGLLRAADWPGAEASPGALLREGWRRSVRQARRGAPDALDLHLVLEPWARVLEGLSEPATAADRGCLSVTIDAADCVVVSLARVRERWGEAASRVVVTALRRGLGRVVHVWDPDDLEWVAEWWVERADCGDEDDAEEERRFAAERVRDFAAAQAEVRRSYLSPCSRAALAGSLGALPAGPVRRAAAALLSEARAPRALWPCRAWERARQGHDGYPTAAVLLTRDAGDAVRHAYDEVQDQSLNGGCSAPPHAVLLLDTRTPARLAATLRRLRRVLRILSWGERLVRAVQEIHDDEIR